MFSSVGPVTLPSSRNGRGVSSKNYVMQVPKGFAVRVLKGPALSNYSNAPAAKFDVGYRPMPTAEPRPQQNWIPTRPEVKTQPFSVSREIPERSSGFHTINSTADRRANDSARAAKANNFSIYPSTMKDTFIYEASLVSKSDIYTDDGASEAGFSTSSCLSNDSTVTLESSTPTETSPTVTTPKPFPLQFPALAQAQSTTRADFSRAPTDNLSSQPTLSSAPSIRPSASNPNTDDVSGYSGYVSNVPDASSSNHFKGPTTSLESNDASSTIPYSTYSSRTPGAWQESTSSSQVRRSPECADPVPLSYDSSERNSIPSRPPLASRRNADDRRDSRLVSAPFDAHDGRRPSWTADKVDSNQGSDGLRGSTERQQYPQDARSRRDSLSREASMFAPRVEFEENMGNSASDRRRNSNDRQESRRTNDHVPLYQSELGRPSTDYPSRESQSSYSATRQEALQMRRSPDIVESLPTSQASRPFTSEADGSSFQSYNGRRGSNDRTESYPPTVSHSNQAQSDYFSSEITESGTFPKFASRVPSSRQESVSTQARSDADRRTSVAFVEPSRPSLRRDSSEDQASYGAQSASMDTTSFNDYVAASDGRDMGRYASRKVTADQREALQSQARRSPDSGEYSGTEQSDRPPPPRRNSSDRPSKRPVSVYVTDEHYEDAIQASFSDSDTAMRDSRSSQPTRHSEERQHLRQAGQSRRYPNANIDSISTNFTSQPSRSGEEYRMSSSYPQSSRHDAEEPVDSHAFPAPAAPVSNGAGLGSEQEGRRTAQLRHSPESFGTESSSRSIGISRPGARRGLDERGDSVTHYAAAEPQIFNSSESRDMFVDSDGVQDTYALETQTQSRGFMDSREAASFMPDSNTARSNVEQRSNPPYQRTRKDSTDRRDFHFPSTSANVETRNGDRLEIRPAADTSRSAGPSIDRSVLPMINTDISNIRNSRPEPQRRKSDSDPVINRNAQSSRPTEPQRRKSDSDQVNISYPLRPITPGETRINPISTTTRNVRWNENLICPSPILPSQRRKGWFNRRGDQLWTNDGAFRPPPAGQEYPADLDSYPDPGQGWMNEEAVRIDVRHRLIPKAPLRSALKRPREPSFGMNTGPAYMSTAA